MSNYEFWDELGNIFDAVVAYQQKTIEFNKRFINPWIRLGNVFDRQDRNQEAIQAFLKAIEIDPANAENWHELGNVYFKAASYEEAVNAYNKALELDAGLGWSYSNLALTFVSQGNYSAAIPLYLKSIELLTDDKDKAVCWNRLGNAYRKLDDYENALQAFQSADDLDAENAGSRDRMDDVPEVPDLVEGPADESQAEAAASPGESTPEEIPAMQADSNGEMEGASVIMEVGTEEAQAAAGQQMEATEAQADDGPAQEEDVPAPEMEEQLAGVQASDEAAGGLEPAEPVFADATEPMALQDMPAEPVSNPQEELVDLADEDAVLEQQSIPAEGENSGPGESDASEESIEAPAAEAPAAEQPIFVLVAETSETYTVYSPFAETAQEPGLQEGEPDTRPIPQPEEPMAETLETELSEAFSAAVQETLSDASPDEQIAELQPALTEAGAEPEGLSEGAAEAAAKIEANEPLAGFSPDDGRTLPNHGAYEEYLKDSIDPTQLFVESRAEAQVAEPGPATHEPVAKIDASGDLQIEMDAKNAHVWNELGNVYFNAGAYDDAVSAYNKAIELDHWFAWPYSNLALAYVQKGRFAEAILLYQRSIELFTNEKDKAISWNRLGNVYRRLNDYDNAIAAYQRADELDPDNTTLSLRSRFSLLGTYHVEQKPNYVS